jgi:hypothetical protein
MSNNKSKSKNSRIELHQDKGSGFIYIYPSISKISETLLAVWLLAWVLSGFIVLPELFNVEIDFRQRFFYFVFLMFWSFFAFKIGYTFFWKKYGKEMLKISEGTLVYKRDIKTYGTAHTYFLENIKNLEINSLSPGSFLEAYYSSFWMMGIESVQFDYLGKTVKLGLQLGKNDAQKLYDFIEKSIKKV